MFIIHRVILQTNIEVTVVIFPRSSMRWMLLLLVAGILFATVNSDDFRGMLVDQIG